MAKRLGFGMLIMALVLGMMVTGCGGSGNNAPGAAGLVGTWQCTSCGMAVSVLNGDGTFRAYWDGEPDGAGTWAASGNILTITEGGDSDEFTFILDGNTLTIHFGVGPVTFSRI